ncbi:D-amino-acid transaminase [Rhizobium sp. SSA_523]|uniref:D-amino-acid transaminase n=1 Tax=Rhizobium sp. SSA_523 TaxID=2952477 RepID=UPI0020913FFD|nr:D-amino-acid transaminase [Rhizobium sp. SSA_523]MCO5733195.1 D-amino-acid transaminase [Rhizobium sp. SSA_523]WKC21814.1 D-amino-acid transaminase [Rhizobium sp. SSA_523]
MSRIVYVNGRWVAEEEASVSVFDRGFLFADAIYEVTAVIGGKLIDYAGHAARLKRSLDALQIRFHLSEDALLALHREILRRNALEEGLIYLQISRGAEDRDFLFSADLQPTIVMFTQKRAVLGNAKWQTGISVITMPEGRWVNRQIKTVQLLYSSLAKMEAKKAGADDAFLVEDGMITEATSSNVHIVTKDGTLVSRPLSNALLHGITRGSILELARAEGLAVEERIFSVEEAKTAAEAFITSASSFVMPVIAIDGVPVGTGVPGPVTARIRDIYTADKLKNAI